MMKVRSKIAYMAMQQKITICELFLNAILKSVNWLIKNGCLPVFVHSYGVVDVFKNILTGNMKKFFRSLIRLHA